jgi:flagellar assembly protein FliH
VFAFQSAINNPQSTISGYFMDISSLPADEVSSLISQILSDQDPASVGLRRIIRRKSAEQFDFPLRTPLSEDFDVPGKGKKILSEDERRVIELEQMNKQLKDEIKKIDTRAREALQKAYAQGFEEGSGKGRERGMAETSDEYLKKITMLQDRTASFLKTVEEEKKALYADVDRAILALVLQIVRKILAVEPVVRPEIVLGILKKALSYISEREKITIRVSPVDFITVSENRDFWAPINERLKNIAIEQDERIERGGCMVESSSGMVDARIGVQLEAITEMIETALDNGSLSHPS